LEELKKRRIEKPISEQQSNNKNAQKNSQQKEKDKENEMSEEEKAKQKSKPISSTAVAGTPWCVVWTRDKRVFFYNPSEKVSLWERPPILMGRADVDKMVKECPVAQPNEPTTPNHASNNTAGSNKKKSSETAAVNLEPPVKKNK
jgi:transcription elongation regulator 1